MSKTRAWSEVSRSGYYEWRSRAGVGHQRAPSRLDREDPGGVRRLPVVDAIDMAAGNIELAPGCVFHSDRGSQYTSTEFWSHLDSLGVLPSVGRTGMCWDNAMAKSFFSALKNELEYRTAFPTTRHARRAIAEYIEVFHNGRRLHSGLGYRTPLEAYNDHLNVPLAA